MNAACMLGGWGSSGRDVCVAMAVRGWLGNWVFLITYFIYKKHSLFPLSSPFAQGRPHPAARRHGCSYTEGGGCREQLLR